jgi:hypothetical protein
VIIERVDGWLDGSGVKVLVSDDTRDLNVCPRPGCVLREASQIPALVASQATEAGIGEPLASRI